MTSNDVIKNIKAENLLQTLTVKWDNGEEATYTVETRDVIFTSRDTKSIKNKNMILIKDEEFSAEESSLVNAVVEDGAVTLKSGDMGYYYSPVYEVDMFKYITATWEAVTPDKSSVEAEVRAYRDSVQDSWTQWYSFGEWGTGIESRSKAFSDTKGNMDIDVLLLGSAEFNANKFQVKVTLKSDGENSPKLYGVAAAFREDTKGLAKAEVIGNYALLMLHNHWV